MTIELNQTLHGYSNGHELLASSIALNPIDAKTLLFQTDLSGPSVATGFEEYISGYPLKGGGMYALSKTWYAPEMSRPGCVWSHTLLISYGDLGKIVDLWQLLTFFKRPSLNRYDDYGKPITVSHLEEFHTPEMPIDIQVFEKQISTALYQNPESAIIIPSEGSKHFDLVVLKIWSAQWPRLRRSFHFCTGALSFRTLDSKPFDLQIIPGRNAHQIERDAIDTFIFRRDISIDLAIDFAGNIDPEQLRRFLWTFGSDIEGTRGNYLNLLRLVLQLTTADSITSLIDGILKMFPRRNDATFLKSALFSPESDIFRKFTSLHVIRFLAVTSDDILAQFNVTPQDITSRVKVAIELKQISIEDMISLWPIAASGRLEDNIWEKFDLSAEDAMGVLRKESSLTRTIFDIVPGVISHSDFWRLPISQIGSVLDRILSNTSTIPEPLIQILVEHESDLLHGLLQRHPKYCNIVFNWFNGHSNTDNKRTQFCARIISGHQSQFKSWAKLVENLSPLVYASIFFGMNASDIQKLDVPVRVWLKAIDELTIQSNSKYAQCVLLSIGFMNRVQGCDVLVSRTFESVFIFAERNQLSSDLWRIIGRDEELDEDDVDHGLFWSIFNIGFRKKKDKVPYWDFCESLIRIAGARFVKCRWPATAFVSTFRRRDIFERTIDYLITFKKGQDYFAAVHSAHRAGRVRFTLEQLNAIDSILNK